MTSPTQRAGADVNFRNETLAEARMQLVNVLKAQKSWLTGYAEAYVDEFIDLATAALQARIAELEAGIQRRDDDVIVPLALYDEINRVGYEWQQRAEAAEARNAASERDAGRYRWLLCNAFRIESPAIDFYWQSETDDRGPDRSLDKRIDAAIKRGKE